MKIPVFSVHDAALGAYMRPFVAQSKGQAIRSFGDEVGRQDSEFSKHPSDFGLWMVGFFDEDTGELNPKKPERVSQAMDFIVKQ